jgi:hypothetical protein
MSIGDHFAQKVKIDKKLDFNFLNFSKPFINAIKTLIYFSH